MELIDRQALLRKLFPYEVVDKKNCVINAYAVEKAILEMPLKNREIKMLCKDCTHFQICYARIHGQPLELLNLTYCEFYKKDDENG